MKKSTSKSFSQLLLSVVLFTSFVLTLTGCGENQAAPTGIMNPYHEILAGVGIDESESVSNFQKLDTTYVAKICHSVAVTGGLIVVYSIGEPTDQPGLRCYLKQVPSFNEDLILTKQAELKQKIDAISAENERQIRLFLKKVQQCVFDPMNIPKRKILNTDINGFFRKVSILMDEPANQKMKKLIFCYSDGINSSNGKDTPADFSGKPQDAFTLCLSGWKTKLPTNVFEIKNFEAPEGFLQYLNSINSSTN